MRDRLIIAENEMDLAPDTVITYTSQLNDIGEIKNQKSNLTNQFKIPKSKENRIKLESAEMIQSETDLPYRKTPAIIKKDGIQIIPKGFSIIESADKFYNVTVYSGNIDLFDRLRDKLISELDLSAFDHTFDFATVTGSRTNVYTDGYKYSIINYGKLNNIQRTVKAYNLRPATFVLMLLNKIFEEAGLEIEYSDLVEAKLESIILPYTIEEIALSQDIIDNLTYEVETSASPGYTYNVIMFYFLSNINTSNTVGSDTRLIPLDSTISDPGNGWDEILYQGVVNYASRQKFTAVGTINVTVNHPTGSNIFSQGFTYLNVNIYRNNVLIYVDTHVIGNIGSSNFNISFTSTIFQFNDGDIVTLKAYTKVDAIFRKTVGTDSFVPITDDASYDVTIDDGFNFKNEIIPDAVYGSPITLSNTLPKIKQSDFVKAFLGLTCGIMKTDSLEGKVYWKSFQDIVNAIPFAEDWSDKLDMKSERQTAYRYGRYARTNNLTYEQDDEDTDVNPFFEGLGNDIVEIDDEVLPLDDDMIELPFAPTLMQKMLIDLNVPLIRKIIDTSTNDFTRKTTMRILIDDTQNLTDITVPELTYEDEDGGLLITDTNIPLAYFILASKSFHLGFSSLKQIFFDGLIASLIKAKIKNESFVLDSVDIMNLDHFKPKWIREFGAYFYLNKVNNWKNAETKVKCEIIRL